MEGENIKRGGRWTAVNQIMLKIPGIVLNLINHVSRGYIYIYTCTQAKYVCILLFNEDQTIAGVK